MSDSTAPSNEKHPKICRMQFGQEASNQNVLLSGWGEPEDGFVWTEGKIAVLSIDSVPVRGSLHLSLWPYVAGNLLGQEMLVFVNGILRSATVIKQKQIVHVNYESSLDGAINLVLYLPGAKSPADLEQLPDRRCLGIALSFIEIEAY